MITQGTVMLAAGILGVVICGGSLCFLPKTFRRQREQLLEKMEMQDRNREGNEKGKGE
ncbi:MAG: hypothetical protein Q4P27_04395 [Eubacteriales bacterium]|nr:hypothetical protein [Eubacteriales bacterium]